MRMVCQKTENEVWESGGLVTSANGNWKHNVKARYLITASFAFAFKLYLIQHS